MRQGDRKFMIKLALCNIFRKRKNTLLTMSIIGVAVFTLVLIGTFSMQIFHLYFDEISINWSYILQNQ